MFGDFVMFRVGAVAEILVAQGIELCIIAEMESEWKVFTKRFVEGVRVMILKEKFVKNAENVGKCLRFSKMLEM